MAPPSCDVRVEALEAIVVELMAGFYQLLGEQGVPLLERAMRHVAEDVVPRPGTDRREFQIAVAAILARMDERLHPS